jgi:nicotinate-nucleotide pyrophosphorylase (carboxylating)
LLDRLADRSEFDLLAEFAGPLPVEVIADCRLALPSAQVGGALNHRFGLFDGMLIKENHAKVAGGLTRAVEKARARSLGLPVMAEARTVEDAELLATLGVDRILLDNFTPGQVAMAVKRIRALARAGKLETARGPITSARRGGASKSGGGTAVAAPEAMPEIEVSGGIRLDNVREFALSGVKYISVGAITHSAPATGLGNDRAAHSSFFRASVSLRAGPSPLPRCNARR